MTERNLASWLPALIGPLEITSDGGDPVEPRSTINFVAPLVASDDDVNERTDISILDYRASSAISLLNIDWSAAGSFSKTLAAGGNTFTFSNTNDGQTIVVVLTGAASTVTWPTVEWAGGVAPTQTASGKDVYTFIKIGSTIYGAVLQDMS